MSVPLNAIMSMLQGAGGLPGMVTGINGPVQIPGMSGGFGSGMARPPVQMPQVTQLPQFLPPAAGFNPAAGPGGAPSSQMPFIRNQTMQNVLAPLMQKNYGIPGVSPYPGALPGFGGGSSYGAPPAFGSGMTQLPYGMPMFGGRMGIQPIRTGAQSLY